MACPSTFAPWTPAEDDAVRAMQGALAPLPGRTLVAVYHRAARLGIKRKPRWTAADRKRLALLWDAPLSLAEIAREMGRTVASTYWHAQQYGLPLGVPDGYEYLTDAAARSGYALKTLRRILRWAGVAVRPVRGRTTGKRARCFGFVEPFDVDEAIEAWLRTEPVHAAARARGLVGETLRDWLRQAGVEDDRKRPRGRVAKANRRHWRVETAVIDRVIAERQATLTARQAAMKFGVSEWTLRRRLRAAGFAPTRRVWFVPVSLVERVMERAS